jgi:glycosyltransferase involved in cell wall biosynthesis
VAGSLTVAVITFKRPAELGRLLPFLVKQAASMTLPADVLVVDNDPDGSARETVRDFPGVRYVLEPHPGIAAARNRALDECAGRDLLVFIDDDETPIEGWLAELVRVHERHGCAAVVGQVRSVFAHEVDEWITAGGFFVRQQLITNSVVPIAATNNLLLDLAQVRGSGLRFDERFGLSGGSDYLFTSQLSGQGLRIVASAEALVHDHVPESRMTRQWVLRRQMRFGNTAARAALVIAGGRLDVLRTRLRLILAGLARIVVGLSRASFGKATGSVRHEARGLRTTMRGCGYVAGALGNTYAEYALARAARERAHRNQVLAGVVPEQRKRP